MSELMKVPPLSILIILDSMGNGGTETHVISLIEALLTRGHRVSLLAEDGIMRPQFKSTGCNVHVVSSWGPGGNSHLEARSKLEHIIQSENVQCIHAHQTPSGLVAAKTAQTLGVPIVFTAHGTYYPKDSIRTLLPYLKAFISVSEPVLRYYQPIPVPASVILNGINLQAFRPHSDSSTVKENEATVPLATPPSQTSSLRSKLGIPENAVLILYASRLAWGKATVCDTLMRAMKDMYRYGLNNLHLVVVGDGPRHRSLQQIGEFINRELRCTLITFVGQQPEIKPYYQAADIVVGTGRVALEALACEKPVMAIGNHGHFGWVEPERYDEAKTLYFGDHGSIASCSRYRLSAELGEGIRRLDSLRAHGPAGRAWVAQDFNVEGTADRVLSVYRSVIGIE